ncbi:MAG: NPCBM/NEW2 domain-containing protein [Sedimentisphaerales bacterium]|nr:NPCBM/NEW2 domain-containing protein [Sedimentisphaerales bacterium]
MSEKSRRIIIILFSLLLLPGLLLAQSIDHYSWASTPPLGWNSWDCFGCSVTEQEVRANADYMASNLKQYGWEYIVVDIQWYEPKSDKDSADPYAYPQKLDTNIDEYGRVWPVANKHPSSVGGQGFKPLADYVHGLGLKFGVHMMRGIPKVAVARKTQILGTEYTAADIADTGSTCPWNPDMYGVDMSKPGSQEYYNSVIELVAGWGVDYIKIDDLSRPYHQAEIEAVRKAIDRCGRPIVFSTSPGATPLSAGEHVSKHANLWRISDDFWDKWQALKDQFERLDNWSKWCGDGHYPDADMLPLGRIRARETQGWTRFTQSEQQTMMSLWCIARSPLMMGGHMPDNDEFTLAMLNNEEVLYVNQNSRAGRQEWRRDDLLCWSARDKDSDDVFLCLINGQDGPGYDTKQAKWVSPVISRNSLQKAVPFAVSLAGKGHLCLLVEDAGDGFNFDHADWLNMELVDSEGNITHLSDLPFTRAEAGWGTIGIDKSILGRKFSVDGDSYSRGIGTHSNSVIEYELPADKYVKLNGIAALDDSGSREKGPGASVQFFVYTSKPEPRTDMMAELQVDLAELGLSGSYKVRDLWTKEDIGVSEDIIEIELDRHSSSLLRLTPVSGN